MSVHFAATEGRYRSQNIDWPPKVDDADQDWLNVGRYTLSYSGPFRLNQSTLSSEQEGQIIHGPIMVASVPKFVGSMQTRNFKVHDRHDGTYLYLWLHSNTVKVEMWWKKLT